MKPLLPWLAFRFPFLPADRLLASDVRPEGPFALAERRGNALRLAAVCPQAQALGLAPGLPLADARARVPELGAFPHDPAADLALLRRLARHAADFTPLVALEPPDALLLEIGGSAHLFGGAEALAEALGRRFMAAHHRHAFGGSPDAALAFARFPQAGGDWLRLPAAALGLPEQAEAGLRRAGLSSLADIARQPRSTIAARFGMEALTALDRLEGSLVRPLAPRRSRPALRFQQRLAEPLLTANGADAVLETLYARAASRLQRLGLGGRRFEAALHRTDGAIHALAVDSGRPIRDAVAIARLFAERIAGLADPLDPGFGYDRITLSVPRTEPLAAGQPGLEPTARADAEDLDGLIDRLSVRFGPDRLLRLQPIDSHIPERAGQRPAARDTPPLVWPPAEPTETPLRPLFLLDPPEAVDVLAEVPDGPPHRFHWRRVQHRVTLAEGPERIAPDWWRLRSGALSGGRSRDYWRVEDSDGHRFWLFRAGFYEDGDRPPGWYMHGLFA